MGERAELVYSVGQCGLWDSCRGRLVFPIERVGSGSEKTEAGEQDGHEWNSVTSGWEVAGDRWGDYGEEGDVDGHAFVWSCVVWKLQEGIA